MKIAASPLTSQVVCQERLTATVAGVVVAVVAAAVDMTNLPGNHSGSRKSAATCQQCVLWTVLVSVADVHCWCVAALHVAVVLLPLSALNKNPKRL